MTKYYSWTIFVLLVSVPIISLIFCVCTSHAKTLNMDFIKKAALSECTKLQKDQREPCQKIIEKRIAHYNNYIKKHQTYLNKLQSDYQKQIKKISSLEQVKSNDKKKTLTIQKKRSRASMMLDLIQNEFKEQQMLSIRVYEEIAGTANTLRFYRAKTQYICSVRDTGRIDCLSLDSLLATYDNEMDSLILSDIDRVHEVYGLDFNNALMFECGPGRWGNLAVSGANLSDFAGFLAAQGSESIMNNCSKYDDLFTNDTAESLMNSGGFSGMTGIDPFGLRSICGMEISDGTGQEFTNDAMHYAEEMHQSCEATLAETMMEGLQDADLPNKEEGDGKKIETATEITQNGDGTETVTTVDGDGNVSTDIRPSTQDFDSISVDYQDGSSGTTKFFSDGSTITMNKDPNGDATMITTQPANGGTNVQTMDPEGNMTEEFIPDELELEEIPTASELPDLKNIPRTTCAGEPCSSCLDFMEFYPDLELACATGSTDSFECSNFARTADCCTNEDAYPADPRVVMPNPEGNFVCMGGADADLVDGMCRAQCSVAYSEDCYSNCMDSSNLRVEFNLLDAICVYAQSEACFTKEGSIPVPGLGGGRPGLGPIPKPELVVESTARLDPGRTLDYGATVLPGSIIEHIIVLPEP